jgi:single-strand DNA-binding protein
MINNVVLVGRIGKDPEMRYTPSGMAVTKFSIGVQRQRKAEGGEQETDWFDIVTFGQTAEFVSQYLDKGAMVGVVGRMQSRTWETQEGQKRYTVEVVAERVQFMESKAEADRRRAARAAREGGGAPGPGAGVPESPPGEDFFGD